MDDIAIGIDLGTTNSCAAYFINGKLKVSENCEGERITPSYIFFTENNVAVVGKYAKHLADAKAEHGIYEIKRLIGRKFDDVHVQNNLQYFPFKVVNESNDPVILIEHQKKSIKKTPQELCTAILTKIKKDVEAKLGQTIRKAVITVPAYFNVNQREITLAAAQEAGFTVLKLLNEPTAAAFSYYLENDCQEENHSLVYDLGGGTFDVAILKRQSTNIDIICVEGDTHLGGQDFDNLIIDYVCEELEKRYNCRPKEERRTMRRLQNLCEEAKKTLSILEETTIVLHGFVKNQDVVEIPLTRKKFETMADLLFKRTIEIVDRCLKSCNLTKSGIKEVILSGGSTRIPKIQKMLVEYFDGKNVNKFVHPDECVAEGAALQAAMLSDNPKQKINVIQIRDVIPLSLGMYVFPGTMSFVIKRNTPIPVSQSSTYETIYNEQKSIIFHLYEGERLNAIKNHFLTQLTIQDITPAPPGQCKVIVTLNVDQNGILTATAQEKYMNNITNLTVVYTRGHRSDSEVKNAVKDAEDNKEEDERFMSFACQKEYVFKYTSLAIYNFEDKNLTETCKDVYELCKEVKAKVENMNIEDQKELQLLKIRVKRRCGRLVEKYNFRFMPTLSTYLS